MEKNLFILLYDLGTGGAAASVAAQTRLFTKMGYNPKILTFDFDPRFSETVSRRRQAFPDLVNAEILNLYQWLREDQRSDERLVAPPDNLFDIDPQHVHDSIENGRRVRREFVNGVCVVETHRNESGDLEYVLHRDGSSVNAEFSYGNDGTLHRERRFDFNQNPIEERFYTANQFVFCTRWIDPLTGNGQGVYEFDSDSRNVRRYSSNIKWHAGWINRLLADQEQRPIVIAQAPSAHLKLLNTQPQLAVRVHLFHNSHLDTPYDNINILEPRYVKPLKRLERMPALVVQTESQAEDIRQHSGDYGNVHVLPSPVRMGVPEQAQARESNVVGIFCRLTKEKSVSDLISIFPSVLKVVPDAKLRIFGDGEERAALQREVDRLELGAHVRLFGRVNNAMEEMAKCAVTVSTSITEAYGLSVVESLIVGTPVIAYDVKYGPSETIEDGKTGYLVPRGSKDVLAERLISLLSDVRKQRRFSRRAQRSAMRFANESNLMEKWEQVFEAASERSTQVK